ncbi:MAG: DUF2973 domain-containing protein [Aphanothece saxicola GSE-SYN-MK-01-06B]|jgi:hypothetical protein|nr:DUF2973 domain-containing protein [Aphanothece saxicola GSE-SYN-MK-01-06B]
MTSLLSQIFPILYGACFVLLLWQAFRVMGRGFGAVPRPGDAEAAADNQDGPVGDRTGRLTIHPELLDADGQLTQEDLLTVRFSGDNEQPAFPADPN